MPNSFSNDNNEILLHSINIDWPCEFLSMQAEVIPIETKDMFRWAVYRILEQFSENPPTIKKAAEELGIMDPVFLTEALDEMLSEGLIEQNDPSQKLDFSNCKVIHTESQNNTKAASETHGFSSCFDCITGEHIPDTTGVFFYEPANPLLESDRLTKRENIGLDIARSAARGQNEPFCNAHSRITDIRVDPDKSQFAYLPVKADIILDENGIIRCCLKGENTARQEWIEEIDFEHDFFKKVFFLPVEDKFYPCNDKPISFDQFKAGFIELIRPEKIISYAVSLINSAKEYLYIDAYWLNFKSILESIDKADHNLEVTILARNSQFPEIPQERLINSQTVSIAELPRIALLTEQQAFSIDQVKVKSISGKHLNIIAASILKPASGVELKNKITEQKTNV